MSWDAHMASLAAAVASAFATPITVTRRAPNLAVGGAGFDSATGKRERTQGAAAAVTANRTRIEQHPASISAGMATAEGVVYEVPAAQLDFRPGEGDLIRETATGIERRVTRVMVLLDGAMYAMVCEEGKSVR